MTGLKGRDAVNTAGMSFELTDEQRLIGDTVRRFAVQRLRPGYRQGDRELIAAMGALELIALQRHAAAPYSIRAKPVNTPYAITMAKARGRVAAPASLSIEAGGVRTMALAANRAKSLESGVAAHHPNNVTRNSHV